MVNVLSAVEAFKLVDTHGLPREIMALELKRRGWAYDEEGFDALMEEQRERGRADRKRRLA